MMKRVHMVVCFALAMLLATSAFADAGDAGGADMGAADMGAADMGMDAGTSDAGMDAGFMDAGGTDGGVDAGPVDMGMDGGTDAATGPTSPDSFEVTGSAVLSTSDAATIEVDLMPADGAPVADFTDGAGRFEFRDLAPGTYDISASYPGFVTQTRTFELNSDKRIDFVLFPDVTFAVEIEVTFVGGSGPVTATARSLGREVVVEADGDGTLELALGAGPWEVDVESDGYVPANLAFNLAADRNPDEPVTLFAVLERRATPEITSDSGCSCSQGQGAPDGAMLALLLVAGLVAIRRRVR